MVTSLVSSKVIIGEMFQDFNMSGTNWLGNVNRHLARALELMRLSGYFKEALQVGEVSDSMTPVPCGLKELIAVLDISNGITVLPIMNSNYVGRKFADYLGTSLRSGSVNFNALHTSFETGRVAFIYHKPPVDDEGYPMIPDNPEVMEALPFYLIMRLGYSGYIHPVVTRQEAEEKWERLFPRARNSVNFPTIEEMDHVVSSVADPYYERWFNYEVLLGLEADLPVYLSEAYLDEDNVVVNMNVTNIEQDDNITVSDTAPPNPEPGDIWIDTNG